MIRRKQLRKQRTEECQMIEINVQSLEFVQKFFCLGGKVGGNGV